MYDELADVGAPRRSGLSVLFGQTPFTFLLPGSVADVEAAASSATVPRSYRLKAKDGVVLLRYYGGGSAMNTPWSVRASLEETPDGVVLTGAQRYLLDRIYFCGFSLFAAVLVAIAVVLGIREGWDSGGVLGCLAVALCPGGLAGLLYGLMPGTVVRQDQRAKQILRDAVGSA